MALAAAKAYPFARITRPVVLSVGDTEQKRGQIYSIRGSKDGPRPPDEDVPRRLAAIVAADIAGYSRLMVMDEEGTHARIKRHRRELVEPAIAEHHGRLVKYTGDGFLAMFDSPVEAVRCAIVIQQSMVGRNAALPRDQHILYRIGVNLGDIIVEPDDVYGDGVNIAARLEGIANPGEVFISGGIYEQIKNKLVCAYQALGERQVKNITDPIRVYRVLPDPTALTKVRKGGRLVMLALGVLAITALGSAAGFYLWVRSELQKTEQATPSAALVPTPASPSVPAPPAPAPTNRAASAPDTAPAAGQASPTVGSAPPAIVSAPPAAPVLPLMVSLPGGTFVMGSNDAPSEQPVHRVTIKPFSISKFPITNREWRECVGAKVCTYVPVGNDDAPVTNVSWSDAKRFVNWLSDLTQRDYRLPSEAEWEYAARAGTQTKFWWGDQLQADIANCKGCGSAYDSTQPSRVDYFRANPFGLHAMGGTVDQWVEDCWHRDYQGAPTDGSAWVEKNCPSHVLRSGSWRSDANYIRPASRYYYDTDVRYPTHGFRIVGPP
jgi:formylglycine-generating enzyme required for sulfatase activity/class 3 adenylate cyclase